MPSRAAKRYFQWLVKQVAVPDDESRWDLFAELHQKQFVWSVPNDDNRIEDGIALRSEFFGGKTEVPFDEGASVLEVLIALSRRIAFANDGPEAAWAWRLIQNLGLDQNRYLDPLYNSEIDQISDILDRLIYRQYDYTGLGGFFPLAWPQHDQTTVEIWAQMAAYLEEQHPEHG